MHLVCQIKEFEIQYVRISRKMLTQLGQMSHNCLNKQLIYNEAFCCFYMIFLMLQINSGLLKVL